jgi:hypothetical protein
MMLKVIKGLDAQPKNNLIILKDPSFVQYRLPEIPLIISKEGKAKTGSSGGHQISQEARP